MLFHVALLTAQLAAEPPRRWHEGRVVFQTVRANTLPEADVRAALEGAIAAWDGVDEGPRLEVDPAAALADGPALDGVNALMFATESWDFDPGELALTFTQRDANTGVILEADIVVNAVDHAWGAPGGADTFDLQNVLTHEVGHALGLKHLDDREATMFPTIHAGEQDKRTLAAGDVDALTALYEGATLTADAPPPAGGCSSTGGAAPGAALLLLGLGSRRRRSSRS